MQWCLAITPPLIERMVIGVIQSAGLRIEDDAARRACRWLARRLVRPVVKRRRGFGRMREVSLLRVEWHTCR
jgi:hypothetical protein